MVDRWPPGHPREGDEYGVDHRHHAPRSPAHRADTHPTLFGVGAGGPAPNLLFEDLGTHDSETISLVLGSAGTWVTATCVPIAAGTAHSGDGQIEAQSGDVVFARAQVAGADVAIGAPASSPGPVASTWAGRRSAPARPVPE